jgi:HPt (histidine-containing phosphotransfer) domain-containing protein
MTPPHELGVGVWFWAGKPTTAPTGASASTPAGLVGVGAPTASTLHAARDVRDVRDAGAEGPDGDPPGALAALERLRGFGGEPLLRDMAAIFVTDTPARIARLERGLADGNAAAVAYAAHTMKSSSAQFGAAALERLCADAERAARAGDLAPVGALLAGIVREFASYRAWLERQLPAAAGQS